MQKEKIEIPFGLCACDYCNFFFPFPKIFDGDKNVHMINDTEASYIDPEILDTADLNKPTFKLNASGTVSVLKNNPFKITNGSIISKFFLLTHIKFKGDYRKAESFILYSVMKVELDYARIGSDYYFIDKSQPNRFGGFDTILKPWKKNELVEDHSKNILKVIPRYNGFCIEPDNINYSPVHGLYYNLYSKFPHDPHHKPVQATDIPTTIHLLNHIFADKYDIGLKYMKILYENPRQILPILVLVSEERETGKTTFLNWIQMIFGENTVLINPSDLVSNFNSSYATKNIILVDEAFVEKGIGVEKLKSIATAKKMSVNPKHVQGYSVDFFGKVIMCSNKELDFMRIDYAEVRFFIRKIKSITGKRNTKIEEDLFNEIPKFLRYLTQLPDIDFSKGRMVFTKEEIGTAELEEVKEESRTMVMKEIRSRLYKHFMNHSNDDVIFAMPDDIKDAWFQRDNNIHSDYIRKVLKTEFKMKPTSPCKYLPLGSGDRINGRPFKFEAKLLLSAEDLQIRQTNVVDAESIQDVGF